MGEATYRGVGGPRCPNHGVELSDCKDGIGICPVSNCRFSYDADEYEKTKKIKINMLGKLEETGDWKVKQVGGGNDG